MIYILLINLFIGYLTLFIAFLMVINNCPVRQPSDWALENFSMFPNEKSIIKFLESQEPLGKDFEKVIHQNLWDLYES